MPSLSQYLLGAPIGREGRGPGEGGGVREGRGPGGREVRREREGME